MADAKDKTVLIVEDDDSIIDLLEFALKAEGFKTDFVSVGSQVLKKLEEMIPDVMILDMMLPERNGYEIIKLLQTEKHQNIPIIVATGKYVEDSFKETVEFEPNVKAFMVKPIKIHQLVSTIHALLGSAPNKDTPQQKRDDKLWEEKQGGK